MAEGRVVRPTPQVKHPLLESMPRWYEVRAPNGNLLFRFCPSALLIQVEYRSEKFPPVDLLKYIEEDARAERRFYQSPEEPDK